jgi:DeoR/GlpR family transcriptional regulator of sugar metabolism
MSGEEGPSLTDTFKPGLAPGSQIPEDMIPAERQQRLLDWLIANVGGSNQELSRIFSTSISTIRRDLDALASQGLVQRTHGGAVVVRRRTTTEPSAAAASMTAIEEKRAIAAEAVRVIEPGQSILIDTGSTMVAFARALLETDIPLTVVTADLQVAALLALTETIKLIVPGGTCRTRAYTLLGEPGLSFLDDIHCDRVFLSAQALDVDCVSDTHMELVTMKRAMLKAARHHTLLIDSSRISSRAIYSVMPTTGLHQIITDEGLPASQTADYETLGIDLIRAAVTLSREDNP